MIEVLRQHIISRLGNDIDNIDTVLSYFKPLHFDRNKFFYIPFPYFWNYFTLVCILLFIVSAVIGKYDNMAYWLMAIYVILMAFLVHLARAMGNELDTTAMTANLDIEKELEMVNFFRNIMVTGTLFAFAKFVAKDKSLVG